MSDWDRIIAERPEAVILNPESGPGQERSEDWAALVRKCQAVGIKVIGYVALGYLAKPLSVVLDEASKHKLWYNVDGIFWDETPTDAPLSSLRALHGYARGKSKTGLSVFNPGTLPEKLYTYMVALPGSIWVTFEGSVGRYLQEVPQTKLYMSRQAHIVYDNAYGLDVHLLMSALRVGWGFVSQRGLPNPYNVWP